MRVLHVLDHSLPYFSGYSFRSDSLIRAQKRLGLQPVVVTSPKHEDFSSTCETIEGVDYYRLGWPSLSSSEQLSERLQAVPMVRQLACIGALSRESSRLAKELEVDLIHAHSPSLNGLATSRTARQLGLPWIYELRYYDEDAAVDRGRIRYNSLQYRLRQRLEQSALEQAPCVVTISSALRADLIRRGIEEEKIFEVPNGVDTSFFQPQAPDQELVVTHGLAGKTIIGFLGSFYFYEGLEYLVDAMLLLLNERENVKLLIAGEGEAEERLRERIAPEMREHFVFAGKVPHNEVRRYYSVMDVLVYPRVKSRLTELTTPLKPLEAMAMGRVVIGSDVGGIRELIRSGETGFLVEAENPRALAECLKQLAGSESIRRETGRKAREFVVQDRDWTRLAARYLDIYQSLTSHI